LNDARYAYDDNNNSIPDFLDKKFNLFNYTANDIANFDGQLVPIKDLIQNGDYIHDLDGDGIIDSEDDDDDNDGILDNDEIKFKLNHRDASDADKDNDGDGITNKEEILAGTDPNDKNSYPKRLTSNRLLTKGWNLVGIDANLTLNELKSIIGENILLNIQGEEKTYKKEYIEKEMEFLNDFEKFEVGKGYWIKVAKDTNLTYKPYSIKDATILLKSGWNLINPTGEITLDEIKQQVGEENLLNIQGEDKTYKKEYVDAGTPFLNDFEKFEEPKGYWIKVNGSSELNF
jgi:hypothetical protein